MSNGPSRQANRLEPFLRWPAIAAASLGAIAFPLAVFPGLIPAEATRGGAFLLAAIGGVLFVRLLFDRDFHRAIQAVNREMTGGQMFGVRGLGLLDPDWGLFGVRTGSRYLAIIRLIALIELPAALFMQQGMLGFLAFSTFWTALMVSFGQIAATSGYADPLEPLAAPK